MNNGFVMLTALLPTEGHIDLIRFAANFVSYRGGTLHVMVCERSFEPIAGEDRLKWIKSELTGQDNIIFHLFSVDSAPQNPQDLPNFWQWWHDAITYTTNKDQFDYVFASENYGATLAETLGAQFIPYDTARDIRAISSTQARRSPKFYWDQIVFGGRQRINRKCGQFVLFGQESVGKTTIAKQLAHMIPESTFSPEWARPYLETVGEDLSEQKMQNIFDAQWAQQVNVTGINPITIMDTDILSTIGYMRLYIGNIPPDWLDNSEINDMLSTHYFLLPDNIAFTKDRLRYGGDKRETTMQYWEDLLCEFDCSYSIVPPDLFTVEQKVEWIRAEINKIFNTKTADFRLFKRN